MKLFWTFATEQQTDRQTESLQTLACIKKEDKRVHNFAPPSTTARRPSFRPFFKPLRVKRLLL